MELTSAELTLLGLVVERPRHGYDLEQVIEQRGIRQWADIGFSSIYYVLTKLEKRGLVEAVRDGTGPKARRVFTATPEGRRVAAAEAASFIADPQPIPHPILVGLANVALIPDQGYGEALRTRLERLDARIAAVREAERSQAPLPASAREIFSYSLTMLLAERSWLVERVPGVQ